MELDTRPQRQKIHWDYRSLHWLTLREACRNVLFPHSNCPWFGQRIFARCSIDSEGVLSVKLPAGLSACHSRGRCAIFCKDPFLGTSLFQHGGVLESAKEQPGFRFRQAEVHVLQLARAWSDLTFSLGIDGMCIKIEGQKCDCRFCRSLSFKVKNRSKLFSPCLG